MEVLIQGYKADIMELRDRLAPLESGNTHTGERSFMGSWTDTTVKQMGHIRKAIQGLEAIVGQYERAQSQDDLIHH